jgi:hypothetical protein
LVLPQGFSRLQPRLEGWSESRLQLSASVANAGFDLFDDRRKVSLCAVVAAASSVRLRFTDWLWKGGALSDATGYDLRLRFGERWQSLDV